MYAFYKAKLQPCKLRM